MAFRITVLVAAVLTSGAWGSSPTELKESIDVLRRVGPDGKGSKEAAQAWKELTKADVGQLPEILAGMDGANSIARNWLRSGLDDVLERARAAKKPFPLAVLESFVQDTKHNPQARRLAYELVVETDAKAAERFLPAMIDDPSPELRHDAIARALEQAAKAAKEGRKDDAVGLAQKAFGSAREKDQIDKSARQLRDLDQKADIAKQLGLILEWKLIGPFPNVEQKGIDIAYPPEKGLDFTASYDGLKGKVHWTDYVSSQEYGVVDLDKGIGTDKLAINYAAGEFSSADERDVEIRIGCINAFKLWINGQQVLDRGDAFTGMSLDHYSAKVHLKAGKNSILIKLSRYDVPGAPNMSKFQLRTCDENGAAILSTTRPASPAPEKKS